MYHAYVIGFGKFEWVATGPLADVKFFVDMADGQAIIIDAATGKIVTDGAPSTAQLI